ncbi:MAG: Redox-sensitive transcriptional regulator [Acidimicrobiaceae bacterium]|jgi:redox-sensing transcriptional repressor|nr:Redox-sensitive transcriptional regulator [Acidimicrobiaceae bacterium]
MSPARGRNGDARAWVPVPSVARLPVYHRLLRSLAARQVGTVSSLELAEAAGVNAATLRRDLSHLGNYGTPGTGYEVSHLLEMIDKALALGQDWPIVIAGAGNLGRALARSRGFTTGGFRVAALVDVNPAQIGSYVDGTRISHIDELPELVERDGISLGVVATPASAAAEVVRRLTRAGVRSVLNFAPAVIAAPGGSAIVRNVDLAAELQVLAFYASRSAVVVPEPSDARAGLDWEGADAAAAAVAGAERPVRSSARPS